jgi:hypothetical protein
MLVLTSDAARFTLPARMVSRCGTLRHVLESGCDTLEDAPVPLPNVHSSALARVMQFYAKVDEAALDEVPLRLVKTRFFETMPLRPDLYVLMNAANYLDATELLDDAASFVADLLRAQTPEAIREVLGLRADVTASNAACISKELDWALAG